MREDAHPVAGGNGGAAEDLGKINVAQSSRSDSTPQDVDDLTKAGTASRVRPLQSVNHYAKNRKRIQKLLSRADLSADQRAALVYMLHQRWIDTPDLDAELLWLMERRINTEAFNKLCRDALDALTAIKRSTRRAA